MHTIPWTRYRLVALHAGWSTDPLAGLEKKPKSSRKPKSKSKPKKD